MAEERKILLINYYWPPCGGSAVQRWLDLTNSFAKAGIACDVITIDDKIATFPFRDPRLNERIAESTTVYRTGSSELFYVYNRLFGRKTALEKQSNIDITNTRFTQKIARFLRGNFFIPDPRRGWNKHALKKAEELIHQNHYEAIFTAGPPQSSHLIGLTLRKKFPKILWVADFHDYWTDNFNQKQFYRTAVAKWIDRRYEKAVLKYADWIMTHCQSSKNLLSKKVNGIAGKILVHTMGYNGDLFADKSYKGKRQDKFVIAYTGILAATYQPAVFLEAVARLIRNNPATPVQLTFAGAVSDEIAHKINELHLENHYKFLGYLSQKDAVELLQKSSVLFLCNPRVGDDRRIVPGKVYEYLAAEKPIISLSSPGSENEQLITAFHAGRNFDWNQDEEMFQYLQTLLTEWEKKKNLDLPDNADIIQFERSHEAASLMKKLGFVASF